MDKKAPTRSPSRRSSGPVRRTSGALALAAIAALGCGRGASPPGSAAHPSASADAVGARRFRVILPRETPRIPFRLDLDARMADGETCELIVRLSAPGGGPAQMEFSLPDGMEALDGEVRRVVALEGGEPWEERLVVHVPPQGYFLAGVTASVSGRQSTAYVQFGDPPTAEERGREVREGPGGERILRLREE